MKKIGLISAMAEESESVLAWLGKPLNTEKIGGFTVNEYEKSSIRIFFVSSGVGEILAAAATELLYIKYGVEAIINFGLVGALCSSELGEMCVVSHVVHYDFDISPLDKIEKGRYSRFPSPLIETDKNLLKLAISADNTLKTVVCASGDKFIADDKIKDSLRREFSADICDMESAGILLTASENLVPTLFIKVVSDTKNHAEEFGAFVERNNFHFVEILDKLIKKID